MRRFLRDAGKLLDAVLPALLVLLGVVAVAVGIGMIYLPAGVIASGALAAAAGVVLIKGGGDES